MSYEPLHHKYRPQTFADLVGQEAIATTLTNAIRQERIAPAYLFTGPRGTGKTSSARILAKSLNCLASKVPIEKPCGVCEVCRAIANGSALDVIEIDAASNTGVDNIREIIERAQFAPVQCRYKVYVIDECLTGDSLVQTSEGLIRIDDPNIKGKKVVSYNESSGEWEFRKVVRWLDQGERQTVVIKTTNREIRCTGNHLIRTETGWIPAKDVKEGVKILSPVNVDAALSFTNLGRMDAPGDLLEDTSLKATHTGKSYTTLPLSWNRRKPLDLSVLAGVVKSLMFPPFYKKKATGLGAFSHTGKSIHTKKHTEFGIFAQKSLFPRLKFCNQKHWDLYTEPCLETAASLTPTNTAGSLDWHGHTQKSSRNGWNTKPIAFQLCDQSYELHRIRDTEIYQSVATHPVIPNSKMFLTSLNQMGTKKSSLWTGSIELPQKDLLGGSWMTVHSVSVQKEVHRFNFIQKDTLLKKIKSLPVGLQQSVIRQKQSFIQRLTKARHTTTYTWAQTQLEPGCQTSNSIQSHRWTTSLEIVESVKVGGVEKVYDIEVENNHNFVANGLCVHNCHMLSVSAFNALLKTLEEPPSHVVFVLATTDPQRVLPTIISRCQRFDFRRIPLEAMVKHLSAIASKENININQEAVQLVAQVAQGGLRDAESLLDQLSLLSGQVTVERVWDLVGSCSEKDLMALLEAIAQNNPEVVLDCARAIMDRGREPLNLLQNLASFLRDLLIAKTAPNRNDLVACTQLTWQALCEAAKSWDISTILAGQQHLAKSEVQIKNTTQPRLWLEVTLLGLLSAASSDPISAVTSQPISPHQKDIQRQTGQVKGTAPTVDAFSRDIALEQPITSSRISQTQQTPKEQAASVQENSQPPIQQENLQPTINQGDGTSPRITEQALAEVEPSPSTSEPLMSANSASLAPREQIWQEVLAHLQPNSTQALLRQMGYLIEFDGTVARIGMKSQALCDKAKAYLPNIRAAFRETFKRDVQVNLELATSVNKQGSGGAGGAGGAGELGASQKQSSPPHPRSPASFSPAPATNQSRAGITAERSIAPSASESPESVVATYTPTNPTNWEEDEVAIAAQRLADFFKGEVVRFQDSSALSQPIETNSLPSPTNPEWYDADAEGKTDIDF